MGVFKNEGEKKPDGGIGDRELRVMPIAVRLSHNTPEGV